jgi:hypothetical protein
MQALFPEWTNSFVAAAIAIAMSAAISIPALLIGWVRTPYVTGVYDPIDQPIQFDHRHHVRDDGIDCLYCHSDARRSPFAGVPPTSLCMNCHNQVWNDSPLLEPVRHSLFSGTPIRWQRVNRLPDFVFFNHAVHVNRGVGCISCHGRVDQMASVYPTERLTMQWCLDCHRSPEGALRPQEHVTDMDWQPQVSQLSLGEQIRAERHIAPPTECTGCHR